MYGHSPSTLPRSLLISHAFVDVKFLLQAICPLWDLSSGRALNGDQASRRWCLGVGKHATRRVDEDEAGWAGKCQVEWLYNQCATGQLTVIQIHCRSGCLSFTLYRSVYLTTSFCSFEETRSLLMPSTCMLPSGVQESLSYGQSHWCRATCREEEGHSRIWWRYVFFGLSASCFFSERSR